MKGYVQLLRPGNCLMGIVATVIAALIALGDISRFQEYWKDIVLVCLTVLAFTGAGNSLNDHYDRETDKLNHPKRPIPSGKVGAVDALAISYGLFAIAFILSLFINVYAVFIVVINLAFMISYEIFLKRRGFVGNLEISWLTASLFIFGGFAVFGGRMSAMEPIWILAFLAFCATLGREIAKDIQDVEGDVDRRTLPKIIGVRAAADVAFVAFLAGISFSPLPYVIGIFSWHYLVPVILADATFIYSAFILEKSPADATNGAKLAMFLALIAFLVGGLI